MSRLPDNKKRFLLSLLCAGAWVLFFALALGQSARLDILRQTLSLRYEQAVSPQKATAARRYAASQAESYPFWPTFWAQEKSEVAGGTGKAQATVLWYAGEGASVWPAAFLAGDYPAPLDEGGVAVSAGLAWRLWGSVDVLGLEVEVDGTAKRVRGVFGGEQAMLLAGVGEAAYQKGWQAVELRGDAAQNPRAEAEAFALQAGLGPPNTLVDGPALAALGRGAAFLSLVLLSLGGLLWILRFLFRRFPKLRAPGLALLLFGAVALLPLLMEQLPQEFVPNRLSDFGFWARTAQQLAERLRQHLLLRPMEIDLAAKLAGIGLAAHSAAALGFGLCLLASFRGAPGPRRQAAPVETGEKKMVWRHKPGALQAPEGQALLPPYKKIL